MQKKKQKELIKHLEEHDREKSEFVYNVSHELRTPLTSITYAADNLLDGAVGQLPEDALQTVEIIKEDCARLTRAVNNILNLSRTETHHLKTNKVKTSFSRLVERTMKQFDNQFRENRLSVSFESKAEKAFILCDPEKMDCVVGNILQNAINYTPKGKSISVLIAKDEKDDAWLNLTITDTGIGIRAEHLPKVTERYFRAVEFVSGTGLGLHICKEILGIHGGTLEIISPLPGNDKGTQVSVGMPIRDSPDVFLVSNDCSLQKQVQTELSTKGYKILNHSPEPKIIDKISKINTDVIIINFTSDNVLDLQIIAALGSLSDSLGAPVISIVGKNTKGVKNETLKELKFPLLMTPWKKDELLKLVEHVMTNHGVMNHRRVKSNGSIK